MVRGVDREAVGCAAGLNFCSFILLLIAVCSSFWTWGYVYPNPPNIVPYVTVATSVGPWIAGVSWSVYPVPCSCSPNPPYFCTRLCTVGTWPVYWNNIPAAAACAPGSAAFIYWAGPLGYCSFPSGFVVPTPPPSAGCDANSPVKCYGLNDLTPPPQGTTFNIPSEIISVQGLIVTACILVFFASLFGCADAGYEGDAKKAKGIAVAATCCSFLGWVLCLAAYCLWTNIPYVVKLQSEPPQIYVPVWVNSTFLSAAPVYDAWLGAGWGTALTASIITFISMFVHCLSIGDKGDDFDEPKMYAPQEDVPPPAATQATPVQATAVPVQVTAVPVQATAAPVKAASVGGQNVANV